MLGTENRDYMPLQITHFTNKNLENFSQERIFICWQFAKPGLDVFAPYLDHYFTGMLKTDKNMLNFFRDFY